MTLQDPCWKLARLLPEPCWIPCWNFARNVVSCFGWCSCFGYCANLWCWKYGINFVGVVLQPCQNLDEDNFLLCFGFRLDFFFWLFPALLNVLGCVRFWEGWQTIKDEGPLLNMRWWNLCLFLWRHPLLEPRHEPCRNPLLEPVQDFLAGNPCRNSCGFFPPNSSWADWDSQFLPETAFVPSWFAGFSWFRLGFRCLSPFYSLLWFRCLSPFFSLLYFLRKGVLFHHDTLILPCSSWFRLGFWCLSPFLSLFWFRCLSPFFSLLSFLRKRFLFHHDLLVLPCSSWFPLGFRCLSPFFSLLWFRCLSPFFFSLLSLLRKGVLFHHALLVVLASGWGSAACLSYSLLFLGSGACLPSSLFFLPQERGSVPSWFASSSMFLLVLAGVPVLVSLLSFFFQDKGSVLSWISRFLLLRAGVPVLVSLLLPFMEQYGWSSEGVKQKTRVRQIVSWNLNCTSPWWKHALLLFGVYAGVIFGNHNQSYRFSLWFVLSVCIFVCFMCGALRSCFMHL